MQTRQMISPTVDWFLYLTLISLLLSASPASSGPVVTTHVYSRGSGKGPTLTDALKNDNITRIIVGSASLDLAHELDGLPAKYRLDRNITITGGQGRDTVLDQQFKRARLQLCGDCTWTFRNITVANDSRGSGLGNDLFVAAELGARVILQDASVLRLACPSPADTLGVLDITPRSAAFRDVEAQEHQQQQHHTLDVTVQGVTYPDALFADSVSTDVAPSQEGRSKTGGYALLWTNTGRPCQAYVPTACLDSQSMESCTQQLTDSLLAGGRRAQGQGSSLGPGALAAAIAVPVCAAALAAAGVGVWCWRGRGRHPADSDADLVSKRRRGGPQEDEPGVGDLEAGTTDSDDSGGPIRPDGQPMRRPLGLAAGWSVAKACTTPYLGHVDDDRIEFGELIGSGSFGRVYQAKWAGRDVAVKVIEHNTDTTVPVEREVTLMLSFNHPNVVRAFHFVTRVHTAEVLPMNAAAHRDNDITKSSSAGIRAGGCQHTPDSTPSNVGNMSTAAAAAKHRHTANAATAAGGSGGSSGGGAVRALHPLPPVPSHKATTGSSLGTAGSSSNSSSGLHAAAGSGNSRLTLHSSSGKPSVPSSSDKPSGAGSLAASQLQLVQRLPSLTGGTPRLVHKVETWLVQEYCDCGTLAAIASEWRHEPESDQKMLERLALLQDCARGLQELHSRNVVHGDLNARNVLLSSSGVTALGVVAKLADLGLSRIVRNHRSHHSTNTVGTMSHVAPELLRYGHMSTAGDVYAFGIMMWELYTGQAAFRKLHVGQFFEAIVVRNLRPMIPRGMSADYQLLMQSCWSASPTDRPSCDRLLNCLKVMIDVRQQRAAQPADADAAGAAAAAAMAMTPHSPAVFLGPGLPQVLGGASGPGTFAGGFSAPPAAAAAASDAAFLQTYTPSKHPRQLQQQQGQMQQGRPSLQQQWLAGGSGGGGVDSPHYHTTVQRSAYSTSAAGHGAAAAAGASALPDLLALLKERPPGQALTQQQMAAAAAGGRQHSSCPQDSRYTRNSAVAALIGAAMPRLTPINTGRPRGSADSTSSNIPVGHSQSDPLPGHGTVSATMQQQILQQLQQLQQQQQYADIRSSGSFHGFPEPSGHSGGSSGIPTPLLPGYSYHPSAAGTTTMVTPVTGVKYQYQFQGPTAAAAVSSASSNAGKPSAAAAATAPLPIVSQPPPYTRRSTGSSASGHTGPLWVPGTSSLARSGSLGTSSRHWYWQRTPYDLNPDSKAEGEDTKSVSDQEGPVEKLLDDVQPGCPDVMAQVQMDNNWYV